MLYTVHPEISLAETLPATFYTDSATFEAIKDHILRRAWHFVGDTRMVPTAGSVYPFILQEHILDEPLMLVRGMDDEVRCLSNVCTHRGMLVAQHPAQVQHLRCAYHGRKFNLKGGFETMPEFKEAQNFPRPCENLATFPLKTWGPFLFSALEPDWDFDAVLAEMERRVGFMPLHHFRFSPERSKEYLVQGNWALYCDNYLEGFHIPFVHAGLNKVLDYGSYETVLYPHCNLQIGYSDGATLAFDLPTDHPDFGKEVAAYYFWIFPNLMFNFYPWGLSINVVRPLAINRTQVSFLAYVYDETKLDQGAGAELDKVEREDEVVVEGVQRGIRSRYYKNGRFSPMREQGVHHFHRLLAKYVRV